MVEGVVASGFSFMLCIAIRYRWHPSDSVMLPQRVGVSSLSAARLLSRSNPLSSRRLAHHEAPQFNEPSGYLFGEKPLPAGRKRKREDWELIWYIGMFGGMGLAAIGLYFKPDTSIQTWALKEAKSRMDASGTEWQYKA